MMKFTLSFLLLGTMTLPVCSQTYQELSERAVVAVEQDSLAEAETSILQALKLEPANPHNALLFSNLGTIQRRRQMYEKALESYTYALNITPRNVPVLLNRATLYLELGRNEQARTDYSLVLDLDMQNQEALLMRAYIYRQERDYKAARSDYERLLRMNPESYNGQLGLATLEQKEGKFEEALLVLNRMIGEMGKKTSSLASPLLSVLYAARASVENEMQHPELALMDLEEALRLDPSQSEAYLLRGEVYLVQKKKELAKRDFEKAISLGVPQAQVRELLMQCK